MIRSIDAFHRDDVGDWVAELDCLHNQHVRHAPPFQPRPWVISEAGRQSQIGCAIDCPLCDRAELPGNLRSKRVAGPFDVDTLPEGLQRDHRVGDGRWGLLRVLGGTVQFEMRTEPPVSVTLAAGDSQPIPPGVDHAVQLDPGARIEIEFLGA